MKSYTFVWSPEGRKLATYQAKSLDDAKANLRREFPQYAKFMGEIYHIER